MVAPCLFRLGEFAENMLQAPLFLAEGDEFPVVAFDGLENILAHVDIPLGLDREDRASGGSVSFFNARNVGETAENIFNGIETDSLDLDHEKFLAAEIG